MWLRVFIIGVSVVAATYAAVAAYGAWRWRGQTQELRARLDASRAPVQHRTVDFTELEGLPAPVERYFRTVLQEGRPVVTKVHIHHHGTFNMSETAERWKPFTSEQWVVARGPGFIWNGRVAMLPGLPVRVHDAYVAGEGILHASLLGLVSVADMRDRGELAEGELMRFFAESTWYPTALLPGQGVEWTAVDDRSARATLRIAALSITMLFTFNDQHLIETVRAEARGRTVDDEVVPTPWQGRFWNYTERQGMRVPLDGEVAWVLPSGPKPYWRGRISEIHYEFAH